jgi:RNA polymerase sigma factor (sigma-70 family)
MKRIMPMSASLTGESRGGSSPRDLTTWDDGALLAAYCASRDREVFAQIAQRHGGMVYRTCFHQLGNSHDSEDAAQAVFLMLAQRSHQVKTSLAGWLYLAARNTATTLLRARRARQKREEEAALKKQASAPSSIPTEELDEGIAKLPDRLREPLIRCYLEGHRQEDAARMLGCNQSTLSRRATEGLERLRSFLVRRGAVVTTALVVGSLMQQKALAVPAALTGKLALAAAGNAVAAGAIGAQASGLADAVLKAAFWAKAKLCAAVVGTVATVGAVSALVVQSSTAPVVPTVERASLRGHTAPLVALAFAPRGDVLATASEDRHIKLWDVAQAQEMADWEATQDAKGVRHIAFAPDGRTLASADSLGTVKMWDVATRRLLASWQAANSELSGLAYLADGTSLIAGSGDSGIVTRWDAATGQPQATLLTDLAGLRCVRLSSDGKSTLATCNARDVRLRDPPTGAERLVLSPGADEADQGKIHLLAFFADGRRIASANYSGIVTVWDVATGRRKANFKTHTQWVSALAASPDGLTLATVGGEKLSAVSHEATIRLFDPNTGSERATLRGHTDSINCVAFSPDGKTLATGSTDTTCKLWMPK